MVPWMHGRDPSEKGKGVMCRYKSWLKFSAFPSSNSQFSNPLCIHQINLIVNQLFSSHDEQSWSMSWNRDYDRVDSTFIWCLHNNVVSLRGHVHVISGTGCQGIPSGCVYVYEVGDAAIFLELPAACLRYSNRATGIASRATFVDLSLSWLGIPAIKPSIIAANASNSLLLFSTGSKIDHNFVKVDRDRPLLWKVDRDRRL